MPEAKERRQSVQRSSHYADVIVELTQMTFRTLLSTLIVSSVAMVATVYLLARHYQDRWLWILGSVLLCLSIMRIVCVAAFLRQDSSELNLRRSRLWQGVYGGLTLAYCCVISGVTLYNFHFHDSASWTLSTIGTFLVCAGLTARVGLPPRLLQACGVTLLGSLAVAILLSNEPLARVGLLLVIYFAFTFYQAIQSKFDTTVEQMRSQRTLRQLAEHDPLTGLANRRHFEATLTRVLDAETPFAILFVDLDRFKSVNDLYGHAVGDILLQRVGVRLKGSVRHEDLVARLGGDDFAILQMAGGSREAAESLARRINRAIAVNFEIEGNQVQIGTSVGIRLSTPSDRDSQTLLSKADAALYRVKQTAGSGYDTATSPPAA